jgi:hypothetical protein
MYEDLENREADEFRSWLEPCSFWGKARVEAIVEVERRESHGGYLAPALDFVHAKAMASARCLPSLRTLSRN